MEGLFGTAGNEREISLPDRPWFGLALYSPHVEARDIGDWVEAVLVEDAGRVCGVQLAQVSCTSTKGNFGRDRVVSERSLRDILNRSSQGRINMIHGFDVVIDKDAFLTGLDILYFTVDVTPVYSTEGRCLIITGPRTLYNQTDVLSYARKIAGRFEIDYGCIVSGLTHFHADSTLTYTHSMYVDEGQWLRQFGPEHPRKLFGKEISYYQSKTQQFGEYIPRACWGNILSPKHVEALGGEARIRHESGAYLVERWGQNLYLQLTQSLWGCTSEDLKRLNDFLVPARFPDAPDPIYLDRSSNAYLKY